MLMSLKNIASVKGYKLLSKDDIAEVVSKDKKEGSFQGWSPSD